MTDALARADLIRALDREADLADGRAEHAERMSNDRTQAGSVRALYVTAKFGALAEARTFRQAADMLRNHK